MGRLAGIDTPTLSSSYLVGFEPLFVYLLFTSGLRNVEQSRLLIRSKKTEHNRRGKRMWEIDGILRKTDHNVDGEKGCGKEIES